MRSLHVTLVSALLPFIALATASTSPASAQSFNCRYAKTPDEVRICKDQHLSGEDDRLAEQYSRLRNDMAGKEKKRFVRDQRAWLRKRKACGSDPDCLARAYRSRAEQLSERENEPN